MGPLDVLRCIAVALVVALARASRVCTPNLKKNGLTFAVPTELGELVMMRDKFYLDANSLTSEIPTQLGE